MLSNQTSLPFTIQEHYAASWFLDFVKDGSDPDYAEFKNGLINDSNCSKTILSLFDYSGEWAKPYFEAGYNVICMDIKHGQDVRDFCVEHLLDELGLPIIYGILCAVPCTEFAVSGARWFKDKDLDGRTDDAIHLVEQTLRTIELFDPVFWAIENPVGRIGSLIPALAVKPWYFNPCDFAKEIPSEQYTKKTGLWGVFTPPNVGNLGVDMRTKPVLGSMMHKRYGGKSERTKTMRSMTPTGFSNAFFKCNQ